MNKTPAVLEIVERIPLPPIRLAVTVARATGPLAAFVTIPTIVPTGALTAASVGAADCPAKADGDAMTPAAMAASTSPERA